MQQKFRHALIAIVLVCLIFSSPLQAYATDPAGQAISSQKTETTPGDEDDTVKLIGQIGGLATDVAIQGDYAYLSLGFKLAVLDISIPATPQLVGEIQLGVKAGEVVVAGNYAYVASDSSLYVVDIANPAAGQVTGSIALESTITTIVVYGSYVYASELGTGSWGEYSGGGVRVVDVSDPDAPEIAGFYDTPGFPRDLAVEGQTLYVAEDCCHVTTSLSGGGLRILSLEDPAAPALVGYLPDPKSINRIAVSGGRVYLLGYETAFLWIIDATSPSAPVELSRVELSGGQQEFADLITAGDWIYVSRPSNFGHSTDNLRIIDARDPRQPQVQPDVVLPAGISPRGMAVAGGWLYVSVFNSGMHVMDLANPAVPVKQGVYFQPGVVNATAIAGQYAYLTDSQNLHIVDISQPEQPCLVSKLSLTSECCFNNLAAAEKLVFLSGPGLQVIDTADPTAPQRIGSVPAETLHYQAIVLQDHFAYVSMGDYQSLGGGLRIFDISDPTTPTLVGSLDLPYPVFYMAVAGEYAYLAYYGGEGNLEIVRISDPQNPTRVNLPEPIPARRLKLVGNYLFVVSDPMKGMQVLDLSSPTAPREVGRFGGWQWVIDWDAAGRYLYLAMNYSPDIYTINNIVDVWDIHDPTHLTWVSQYFTPFDHQMPGSPTGLTVANGNVYLSAGTAGLIIIRFDDSAGGGVRDFYGNPAANVSVSADEAATVLTDSSGNFNFSSLPWDDYTLSPELAGYAFWPPQKEIVLPGEAHGVNFTLLAAPASVALKPGLSASLSYTDTQGLLTSIELPANATPLAATLTITPTLVLHQDEFLFTGHAFILGASPDFVPAAPLTATIHYSDQDAWSTSGEEQLRLWWWNGASWEDAAQTCTLESAYSRNLAGNTLRLSICKLGLFALFRPGYLVYLPLTVNQ